MWFKRQPRNRRLERGHVLEVKLRSSQVRAARLRLVGLGLTASLATVLGILAVWRGGEWALERLVYQNKAFALEHLDIQTDGIIATGQLRRWAGVKLGDNLLALDLARVQRDLLLVPLIEFASVDCIPPHTLRIRVAEREPVAQVNLARPRPGGGLELTAVEIDAQGYVLQPLDPRERATPQNQAPEQLTLLSGIDSHELLPGRKIESPQVLAGLQLIQAFEHSPMVGLVELKRIDVSAPEVLVVSTSQGSEVTFGLVELERQLRRWREIFDRGQKAGRAIAFLDLAVTNSIPARWLEAGAVPPSQPKSIRTLHTRKKHV